MVNIRSKTDLTGYATETYVDDAVGAIDLSPYVPYTGADQDVLLGANQLGIDGTPEHKIHIVGNNQTNSSLRVGSLEFQPYAKNNCWFGDNVYFNGNFKLRENGKGGLFYFAGDEGQFRFYTSGTAGDNLGLGGSRLKINANGTVAIGGDITYLPGSFTGANMVVSNSAVTITPNTTITGTIGASNLSGTNTGDQELNILTKYYRVETFTSAGINTAIDALGSDGGEIYLPEGEYAMSGEVTIDYTNTTIRGSGKGTILKFDALDNETMIGININGKDNVVIRDLVIDGDKASQSGTAEHRGIHIADSDNVQILNVTIQDIMGEPSGVYGDGIFIDGTDVLNLLVDGCKITGCEDDGIDTDAGTELKYARFVNNYIEDIGDNGIDTEGIAYSIISNNTVKDCDGNAIEVEQEHTSPTHCLYNTVDNNNISNVTKGSSDGIVLASAKFTSVVGNVISNCVNGVQILTGNTGNYSLSNTIIGNNIEGCTTGIDEADANQNYNYISGNMMSNNTADYDINGINTMVLSDDGTVFTFNQDTAVEGNLDADTITNRSQEISPTGDTPALVLNRSTDSSPTSDIMKVYKNDGSTLLMSIQYDGRLYVASASASPTIVAGTGGNTGAAVTVTGSDGAGLVSVTTAGTPAASATIATITFSRAFNNAPAISLTPANANASALTTTKKVYPTSTTTTFLLKSGSTALTTGTTYQWHYQVLGT